MTKLEGMALLAILFGLGLCILSAVAQSKVDKLERQIRKLKKELKKSRTI